MRLRHKPWAEDYINENRHIVPEQPERWQGRWSERFEQRAPLHVEIGTGKGRFVNELAASNPEINVIGIELMESVLVTGVQRAADAPKKNLQLLQADVKDIGDFFAPGEIDRLYINFTDPWPKKRHAKRRLTHEGFLNRYVEVMNRGAEIHMKTDNQGLFEYSLSSLTSFGFYLRDVSLDLHRSGWQGNIMTEYEEKFFEKGMPIYRLEAALHQ
ncbi:tRNA (guanosine(46)-N7)-methyltransferase TrmB [Alkalicoccus chagannorensis]|uniref:tRNA (guanosine(46)-N7)-methyltransferase TrmB n=1 Tax=Alkalicoccus chagannorensis TaxID=427072 RepID=UPI000412FA9F|nr:tRNA (guanosine(46)-N7)-methyltransferase TrmB [Alkalicoccus chagannorensis]